MTFPFLLVGLILLLAGSSWFTGAATVGIILIVVGGVGLLIQLVLFLAVLFAAIKAGSVKRRRF